MVTKEKDEEIMFILGCIELYRSLPFLWNINSNDYGNRKKKNEWYEQLLPKYREYFTDADKSQTYYK